MWSVIFVALFARVLAAALRARAMVGASLWWRASDPNATWPLITASAVAAVDCRSWKCARFLNRARKSAALQSSIKVAT